MKKLLGIFIVLFTLGINGTLAEDTGTGTNVAPVAVDDLAVTNEGVAVDINLVGNDTDINGNNLRVISLTSVVGGIGEILSSGTGAKFTPNVDFF